MKRFLPKSLFGQTILVLLIGLTLSHAVSMVIYTSDRGEALSIMGGRQLAQRMADIIHLVRESPAESRSRIVAVLNDATFKVTLSPESKLVAAGDIGWRASLFRKQVEAMVRRDGVREVRVQLIDGGDGGGTFGTALQYGAMRRHMTTMLGGTVTVRSLRISAAYADGQWINFTSELPETGSFWSATSLFSLLSMAAAVFLLSVWVVRRLTKPFGAFADAAQRLGRDVHAQPLAETGPIEIRQATRAFNDMQERLGRFVDNRTRMLAAISHDLRTPITRLRLRAELVEDKEERTKMLATLDDMEAMIASTLAFAREEAENEDTKTVDLSALLESICDDTLDAGGNAAFAARQRVIYDCRPTAMKRAFTNLVDNAVKYGGCARVRLERGEGVLVVTVEDDGPGIDPGKLEQVFQPFVRIEPSRNPETGGVGLGLSVAQTIIHAHGGEIELANREEGGLAATVRLPASDRAAASGC